MDLSIVLPAFNEGGKIGDDVTAAAVFLKDSGLSGEVIVVDDGSSDNTAREARRAQVPAGVEREVVRFDRNRGKGHAVKAGVRRSRGDYVLFADAGLCVPFDNVWRGLRLIGSGMCEIAHGSRVLRYGQFGQPKPWTRRILSAVLRLGLVLFMRLPAGITDTQCGFKLYRGDVGRELYADLTTEGFGFDVEVLLRAVRRRYEIREFPVDWVSDLDSRLRPGRHAFSILSDLIRMRRLVAMEESAGKRMGLRRGGFGRAE